MTEEVKPESHNDIPAIFAGSKFYDLLISTRTSFRDARVAGNYDICISLGYELYDLVVPFMNDVDDKKVKNLLDQTQKKIDAWSNALTSTRKNPYAEVTGRAIRDLLREFSAELHRCTKDLWLKTSKGDSNGLDFTAMSRGM